MTLYKIRQTTDGDRQNWISFVERANNGTIFHSPEFLDYHPEGRFNNHHLVVENSSGKPLAYIPGALSEMEGGTWFRSYPGASYGGPVLDDRLGLDKVQKVIDSLLAYCRKQGFAGVEMTPPPICYFRRPHNYIDFALIKNGFDYRKRELTAVIDLRRLGEEIDLGFSQSARRGVKKALKSGLKVLEDNDYSRFYPVLANNLKDRHGVKPTHSLKEIELLRDILGQRSIRQFVTVNDSGEVLAGMVMFHCNPRVTLAFYISHNEEFQTLRPVNLVYREVIDWARKMGYCYLDLGTYTLNMEVNHGLCRFKESFSARGQFRNTLKGRV
ncbi:GNAT family N-acetyltransferase [Candidatus Fermentibacteria bacterium]|nr:MAG: GNAT family N-acetyltransferase [Candidatus Fermentibacteria bacterium]